jgi:hydrogenase/urease accessory protein HupE
LEVCRHGLEQLLAARRRQITTSHNLHKRKMRPLFNYHRPKYAEWSWPYLNCSVALLWFGCVTSVWGHDPGLSVATALVTKGELAIHLAMARTDVQRLINLDADQEVSITNTEFQAALPRFVDVGRKAFAVKCAGRPLPLVAASTKRDNQNGIHFLLSFAEVRSGQLAIRSALLEELPRGHRQFLSVRDEKGTVLGEQMLDASRDELGLDCTTEVQPRVVGHSVREFLGLGVMHIATGYDHLLFLLGLLLVGGNLRSALQIITSFTCAHSITLALATLNVIHIPARIIEPLIAASIVYVGLENLLRPAVKGRWRLTFAFGLIHGCGFASALRDLGVGSDGLGIVTPLLSFNLGVELGQITIAALVLPVIWKLCASQVAVHRLVPVGSALIVIAGSFWLVQRVLF